MKQLHRHTKIFYSAQYFSFFIATLVLIANCAAQDELNYRLPNNTYPLRYNIELTTRIHDNTIGDDRFRFEGKVTIQLMTSAHPTNSITLNYRQINITHVRLWNMLNGWEQILLDDSVSFAMDPKREFLTINSPQPLNGSYYLELQYNGTLREDNAGFYRSSYRNDNDTMRWLATTQFSSTDARHAFPCYDEPGIRAPIGLRVTHGKNYTVLSNSVPIHVGESLLDGMVTTTFADTPSMQSYLLGIVVSDFIEVSLPMYGGQKAFARHTALINGEANFMVEAGSKILARLEDFLETRYILPKLYHVAIPDFAPGAMENYGLITYKEENFFYNNISSPMKQRKQIVTILGHEIGHHFFGNYVSPAWWSYLWMKEGFARFFEYIASQMVYPELEIDGMYAVEKTHNVFEIDSFGSVRPMTFYVNTQSEIAKIFDDIAYDKGGAVLRMFYHALGQETFRQALVHYLHENALQGAKPEQFAAALQKGIDDLLPTAMLKFSAKMLLESWTEQAGYPVIYVSRSTDCSLMVRQEKYLLKNNESNFQDTWILPYNFATARLPDFENTSTHEWLMQTDHVIRPTIERNWTCDDWIVFNKQQTGYYRVNYDEELWNMIIDTLLVNISIIHRINRAQVIDDALNNARSGRLEYAIPLRLLQYLSNEHDYIPWASVDRNLRLLDLLLGNSNSYPLWHRYCLKFIEPVYNRMGIATRPQDTLSQRLARHIVVMWACKAGSLHCINETAIIVKAIAQNDVTDADPDMRESIYCNGLRYAASDVFKAIWKRLQESQDQAYRSELIRSLGCVQDAILLEAFLNSTIENDGANFYGSERDCVLEAVYNNGVIGMKTAIKFFISHMDQIHELYNKGNFGGRAISTAVRRMAKQTASEEMYIELRGLMEQLLEKGFLQDSEMLQALEQCSENIMWLNTRGRAIEIWLKHHFTTPTQAPTMTEPPMRSSTIGFVTTMVTPISYIIPSSSVVATTLSSATSSSFLTSSLSSTLSIPHTLSTELEESYNENSSLCHSHFKILTIIVTAVSLTVQALKIKF